ncbi:MAG: hypothetical protein BECKG1743E_GA0114224_102724 [Candidatus Kentron sp. G]|nr:MAG: hypothetical protein BECKG1743E_GA0114224_102724 [Candidatus Kentron sp. G]
MSILSEFLTMLGVQDDFCIQLDRLYRKCSHRPFRSIGCGPPRWISDNYYSLVLFGWLLEKLDLLLVAQSLFYFINNRCCTRATE